MSLSDRIRDEIKAEIGPCPTCGHARMTASALASDLGQPASSVGRFLAGGKPSVALLDAADAWLQGLAERRRWRAALTRTLETLPAIDVLPKGYAELDGVPVEIAEP